MQYLARLTTKTLRPALLLPLFLLACSATSDSKNETKRPVDNPTPNGSGGQGGSFDGNDDGSEGPDMPVVATLRGRVYAPEGTIPISGALVYVTATKPKSIPDRAYCDQCVELDASTPHAFTTPTGEFELGVPQTGDFFIVVQKGQFRRVRHIEIVEGEQQVPKDKTTFPDRTSKAFDDNIPKMAIMQGTWDAIDVSLAKLGLGKTRAGFLGKEEVDREQHHGFDYVDAYSFLRDPERMSQYHIIFKPCNDSEGTECKTYSSAAEKDVQNNLREYVKKGGKLYATDYDYEYVRQPWPEYLKWNGQTNQLGSACNKSPVGGQAEVVDTGLREWLEHMGYVNWDILGSWIGLDHVNPVQGLDADGNPATITPTVWVQSKLTGKPATVSFEYGCGRVLHSAYHTESGEEAIPQKMALLYVLLEVGVCIAPPTIR